MVEDHKFYYWYVVEKLLKLPKERYQSRNHSGLRKSSCILLKKLNQFTWSLAWSTLKLLYKIILSGALEQGKTI